MILKAFELRADGVMLVGCEPGSCQFGADSACIDREYHKTQDILGMLGIRQERLSLAQLRPFDGYQFVAKITNFINEINIIPARRTTKVSHTIAQTTSF